MFIYKERFHHSWKDVGKSKSEMKVIYMKESIRVIYELRMHLLFGDIASIVVMKLDADNKGFPYNLETRKLVNKVFINVYKSVCSNENS